jgi:hypothetical protein
MDSQEPSKEQLHPFLKDSRQFAKMHKKVKVKPTLTKPFTIPENKGPVNRNGSNRWWENFWD